MTRRGSWVLLTAWVAGCTIVAGDLPEPVDYKSSQTAGGAASGGQSAGATGGTSGVSGAAGDAGANLGGSAGSGGSPSGGTTMGGSGGTAGATTGGNSAGGTGAAGHGGSGGTSAGTGGCDPCDCDNDGALAESCSGDDCDDNDPRAKPEQGMYFSTASDNQDVGFDFNCSNSIERDPMLDVQVNCGLLGLGACPTAQGFISTPPACGQSGDWAQCRVAAGGLLCERDTVTTRVMSCH